MGNGMAFGMRHTSLAVTVVSRCRGKEGSPLFLKRLYYHVGLLCAREAKRLQITVFARATKEL